MTLVPEDPRGHQAFWSTVHSPRKVKVIEPRRAYLWNFKTVSKLIWVSHVGLKLTVIGKMRLSPW